MADWDSSILNEIGFKQIHEGSYETRFEYFENSKDHVILVGAIQGHTGGKVISPELMFGNSIQ